MKRSSVLFTELDRRLSLSNNNQNKRKYKEENKKCRKNRQREKQRDFDKVNNKTYFPKWNHLKLYYKIAGEHFFPRMSTQATVQWCW